MCFSTLKEQQECLDLVRLRTVFPERQWSAKMRKFCRQRAISNVFWCLQNPETKPYF
eukprot:UN12614